MQKTFSRLATWCLRLLSVWLLSLGLATATQAHEIQPTIADLSLGEGEARLVLRLNLEAFLAGVDLDGLEDTDDAENAEDYDALRALDGTALGARLPQLLAEWNALPLLTVDGAAVALETQAVSVPDDIDFELARASSWTMTAAVPEGAQTVTLRWPDGGGALVLRQQGVESPYTGFIDGGETSPAIVFGDAHVAQGAWPVFVDYIFAGFDHIIPKGLDHILFVLGLFLLSTRIGPLLWQVTAFTLAHTVTLALGALGLVNIPGSIVEPLIAASIVYVAVENIFSRGLSPLRPFIVFGFGLLHGLGFASVLGDFGLPSGQFVPALIGFNIGVEIGQLSVIALTAALIWLAVAAARVAPLNGLEEEVREYSVMFRAVSVTGSLLIAVIGAWWVVERVFL